MVQYQKGFALLFLYIRKSYINYHLITFSMFNFLFLISKQFFNKTQKTGFLFQFFICFFSVIFVAVVIVLFSASRYLIFHLSFFFFYFGMTFFFLLLLLSALLFIAVTYPDIKIIHSHL